MRPFLVVFNHSGGGAKYWKWQKRTHFLKSLNPGWALTKNLFVDSTNCCLANRLLKNHNGSKTTKKVAFLNQGRYSHNLEFWYKVWLFYKVSSGNAFWPCNCYLLIFKHCEKKQKRVAFFKKDKTAAAGLTVAVSLESRFPRRIVCSTLPLIIQSFYWRSLAYIKFPPSRTEAHRKSTQVEWQRTDFIGIASHPSYLAHCGKE